MIYLMGMFAMLSAGGHVVTWQLLYRREKRAERIERCPRCASNRYRSRHCADCGFLAAADRDTSTPTEKHRWSKVHDAILAGTGESL